MNALTNHVPDGSTLTEKDTGLGKRSKDIWNGDYHLLVILSIGIIVTGPQQVFWKPCVWVVVGGLAEI